MPPAIMQPTSERVNSRTVCQPRVMMLLWPAQREDTSTMGPGSRYRRTWLTGNSRFSGFLGIGVLSPSANTSADDECVDPLSSERPTLSAISVVLRLFEEA